MHSQYVSLGVIIRHIPERIIGCPNSPHSWTYHWVSQFATFLYVSLGVIIGHIPVRIIGFHNSPHSWTYHWVSQFATFLYVSLGVTIRHIPVRMIRLWQCVTRRFKISLLILTSIHYFFAGNDKTILNIHQKYSLFVFVLFHCNLTCQVCPTYFSVEITEVPRYLLFWEGGILAL